VPAFSTEALRLYPRNLLADKIFILTSGPAKLLDVMHVDIPRPRRYEDERIAELEGQIVERVMEVWGMTSHVEI
jgi:ABC-type nitrate/sulfonate/bicarbonate transport system ATPase subunit